MAYKKMKIVASIAMVALFAVPALADDRGNVEDSSKDKLLAPGFYGASPIGGGSGDNFGDHKAAKSIDMSGFAIRDLGDPAGNKDAANKKYVDDEIESLKAGDGMLRTGKIFKLEPDQLRRTAGNSAKGVMSYNGNSRANGVFYSGNTNPSGSTRLNYSGNLYASTFYSSMYLYTSDETLKKDVVTIEMDEGMANIRDLRPVSYTWIETGENALGVIAQEVEKILPTAVKTDEAGIKAVDYVQMISPMLAAIQGLDARVQQLEARVQELEAQP